jgi:hypothetical protein
MDSPSTNNDVPRYPKMRRAAVYSAATVSSLGVGYVAYTNKDVERFVGNAADVAATVFGPVITLLMTTTN